MSNKYTFKDYDKYLCLKPPAEFWLLVLFFLRPFILKISTFQMGRGAKSDSVSKLYDLAYPENFVFFLAVLSAIPAIVLLISYAKRNPGASDLIQKIWRNGIKYLALAAILNILVIFIPIILGKIHAVDTIGWAQLGVILLIFGYLYKSQRLRDAFADFPKEIDDEKNRGNKA